MRRIITLLFILLTLFTLSAEYKSGDEILQTNFSATFSYDIKNTFGFYNYPYSEFSPISKGSDAYSNLHIDKVTFKAKPGVNYYQTDPFYAVWQLYSTEKFSVALSVSYLKTNLNGIEYRVKVSEKPEVGSNRLVSVDDTDSDNGKTIYSDSSTPSGPRVGNYQIILIIDPQDQDKYTEGENIGEFIIAQNRLYEGSIVLKVTSQ